MKIMGDPSDGSLVITEVYSGFLMRTCEGNEIAICMRDDTFEINVCPKGEHTNNWWRINMQTGEFEKEVVSGKVMDTACESNDEG